VWREPASRSQRGEEYREAWAEPSGRRGSSHVGELRIRGALPLRSVNARQNAFQTIDQVLGESAGSSAAERDAEKIREQALAALHALAALLAHKAPAEEANEFKRWLLEIGQRVADASKEGDGGSRVTEKEAATLGALATVLEVESPR
jgi:hypothetical protein